MERKKDLAKLALTALLLSATAPAQADQNLQSEVFLAALGCAGSSQGCAASGRGQIADNTDTKSTSSYSYQPGSSYSTQPSGSSTSNTRTNTSYPGSTSTYGTGTSGSYDTSSTPGGYSSTGGYRGQQSGYGVVNRQMDTGRTYNDTSYNSYNANRTGPTSPSYVDSYRGTTEVYEASPYPYGGNYGANTNLNRDYNTSSDYDYNRGAVTTSTSSATLTEAQLLGMLNPQARAIYLSLDSEGKSLAIQLASQDSYRDKNLAVKEAQRRMNDRRGMMSR